MRSIESRTSINKAVGWAVRVPIAAVILGCAIATDSGIPKCDKDSEPTTKIITLFPESKPLSVEGNFVTAVLPAGKIDIKPRQLISPSKLERVDGHVKFQGVSTRQRNARNYSIKAAPDTNPDNIGRNGTVVTIQADCDTTPKTNP